MTTNRGGVTAGALKDIELSELIQLVSLGQKTALLKVRHGRQDGRIWFEQGSVVHASLANSEGLEAFNRILAWASGDFFIEHGKQCGRCTIDADTTFLLIDALRQKDESGVDEAEETVAPNRSWARMLVPAAIATLAVSIVLWVVLMLGGLDRESPAAQAPPPDLAQTFLVRTGSETVSPLDTRMSAIDEPWFDETIESVVPLESAVPEDTATTPEGVSSPARGVDPKATDDGATATRRSAGTTTDAEATTGADAADGARARGGADATDRADAVVQGTDASQGGSAPGAPLEGPPVLPMATPSDDARDTGYLEIETLSRVKTGTLILLIDGEEILRRELRSTSEEGRRVLERVPSGGTDGFEKPLALSVGRHDVVAQLIRPDRKNSQRTLSIDVTPGEVFPYRLLLGRSARKPVVWKAVQRLAASPARPVAGDDSSAEASRPARRPATADGSDIAHLPGTGSD